MHNVRGGAYTSMNLSINDQNHIDKEIFTALGMCMYCGSDIHLSSQCVYKTFSGQVKQILTSFKINMINFKQKMKDKLEETPCMQEYRHRQNRGLPHNKQYNTLILNPSEEKPMLYVDSPHSTRDYYNTEPQLHTGVLMESGSFSQSFSSSISPQFSPRRQPSMSPLTGRHEIKYITYDRNGKITESNYSTLPQPPITPRPQSLLNSQPISSIIKNEDMPPSPPVVDNFDLTPPPSLLSFTDLTRTIDQPPELSPETIQTLHTQQYDDKNHSLYNTELAESKNYEEENIDDLQELFLVK